MRVGVPFPLKTKSLLVTAGILVPMLAALNVAAWFYGFSLPIGSLAALLEGLPYVEYVPTAYPAWLWNAALSAVFLFIGLATVSARASFTARRIVRLIEAAERFEDGVFDNPAYVGQGSIAALERSGARLGSSLAVMLRFANENVIELTRKNCFSPSAESPTVTLAVFCINNYHRLARLAAPEQMNKLANELLARIVPSIIKTGGAVNKIWTIDDFYVLAVWGNTSLIPNLKKDAVAALRSCILVRSAVKTMNRDMRILAERTGYARSPQISVSMGLDSGEAIAGLFGAGERKEYSILGAVVKNAVRCARIGAKTGKQIVMTERTFGLGGVHFVTQEMTEKNAAYFSPVKPMIGVGVENALS